MEEFNETPQTPAPEETVPAETVGQSAAPEQPELPQPVERVQVCDVQFRSGGKIYFFDPNGLDLKNGEHVIIDTARGAEYGYCILGTHRIAKRELVQPLRKVIRIANAIDRRIKEDNERKEKEAYAFCMRKVEELGLDMQLVSAECAFDGSKLLFFFTADARVDFRELVKILASNYHTRIELRQIGVRDKAKMLGGLGICGRPFCCASFLDDFEPVSIKMAKTQNLSLNPTKISGTCGRLMCCLKYEQEAYEDLIKNSPKPESFVDTPEGRGTVTAVNLMRQSVTVQMEKDSEEIRCFRNGEICVLRSGKARKTDPPIPDDLAPISGRRDPEDALRARLDHRLTLSAEEAEEACAADPEPPAGEKPSRRRSERSQRQEQPAARPEQPAALPEQPEEKNGDRRTEPDRKPDGKRGRNRKAPKLQEPVPKAAQEIAEKQAKTRQKKPNPAQGKPQRQKQEQRKPNAEPKPQPAPAPAEPAAPKPEGAKKNRRRFYHNHKPKSGGKQ
ncbi:MAG: hypothetical protein K6F19_05980 [Oscillospiraceae bacterium]|nr:hypothetical protein [Oscillospiraceae bacterium]